MPELIAIIIFLGSVFGIAVILMKKIPILAEMPQVAEGQKKESFASKIKNGFKNFPVIRDIYSGILLQKILSKIRVLTLKVESKTAAWLQKIRVKSQGEKDKAKDNYWTEVKNEVKSEASIQTKNDLKSPPSDNEEKKVQ
jgi:hypothetical protein